jgi:phospholipid/cholesterol/gamma-HCH transport system substrate-binding protein
MQNNNRALEVWVGLFVALGILALAMLAFRVGNLSSADVVDGYHVKARFDNIGQLRIKAPIALAGVRIGRVSNIAIDDRYYAVVTLNISGKFSNLPKDTSAAILTSGLLGEQYVAMEPGGSDEYLKEGDVLQFTQSAVILEKLIGQFLFNKASEGDKK